MAGPKCSEECPGDDTCVHAADCMCGGDVTHSPWEGHSPISQHDYYAEVDPAD